jgi:GNAT superfamily N-acetyltransferase
LRRRSPTSAKYRSASAAGERHRHSDNPAADGCGDDGHVQPSVDLIGRARAGWAAVAGVADAFVPGEVRVVVAAEIPIAPPGWTGIVSIGDACLVMAPDELAAAFVSAGSTGARPGSLPGANWTPAREVLGPAALLFGEVAREVDGGTELLAITDPRVQQLLDLVPAADAVESGLGDVTSSVFAVVQDNSVIAACGYRHWPGELAHLSVLTDPRWRREGFARRVAAAAISAAAAEGLLPQWRARPVESQRLARSLGLVQLGAQISLRLGAADDK